MTRDATRRGAAVRSAIEQAALAIDALDPASIDEGGGLQHRRERKLVLAADDVPRLLALLAPSHRILLAGEARVASYETVYFDTAQDDLYRDHHRGAAPRFKVRVREHRERALAWLEIKTRDVAGLTVKTRRERPIGLAPLDEAERAFVAASCTRAGHAVGGGAPLQPALHALFDRITLAHREQPVRTTIDLALSLETRAGAIALPGLAILEIKAAPAERDIARALKKEIAAAPIALERGFSKYCLGRALLDVGLPIARFRKRIRSTLLVAGRTERLPPAFFASDDKRAASG